MKKIILGLSIFLAATAANADFFGSNNGEWKMGPYGPYWDESDWPEWTPMYWMEEFMDEWDDDDDQYGYGGGYGMPMMGGYGMPQGGGYGYPAPMPYGGGYGMMPPQGYGYPAAPQAPMQTPMQPPMPAPVAPAPGM
jgi:hypothetical protein